MCCENQVNTGWQETHSARPVTVPVRVLHAIASRLHRTNSCFMHGDTNDSISCGKYGAVYRMISEGRDSAIALESQ
jgi:hypothetical protein